MIRFLRSPIVWKNYWKYNMAFLSQFSNKHMHIFLRECKKFAVMIVPIVFMPCYVVLQNKNCCISINGSVSVYVCFNKNIAMFTILYYLLKCEAKNITWLRKLSWLNTSCACLYFIMFEKNRKWSLFRASNYLAER